MSLKINVDSHFVIGKKHLNQNTPCQDHSLCGMIGEIAYVVISDGCSSGRHTDIGARIITCALSQSIKKNLSDFNGDIMLLPDVIHADIVNQAQLIADTMGLENQDLLATCVYAIITPDGGFIHILGDGSAIIKSRNNELIITTAEWQRNTPYYPAENRKSLFIREHSQPEDGSKSMCVTQSFVSDNGSFSEIKYISIQESVKGYVIYLPENQLKIITDVIVCSDGVESFKQDKDIVNSIDIIPSLVSFKNYAGDFMKRRLSRGLLEYSKQGMIHDDDIAMAAIHIAHTINPEQ